MTIIDQPSGPCPTTTGRVGVWAPGHLVGVEHEYVLRRGTERVDARRTLALTRFAEPALDPGDPNARRLSWGGVVTFDGPEVEVVTPPAPTVPGFATRVADECARGRQDVASFIPDGVTLEGFSTHLNVSVTPGREVTVARRFISTFSAAMMLLVDDADSPGILVRPRPGRLEIGGEFRDGTALITALVFATGAARCCDVTRRRWNHQAHLHGSSLTPKVERAVERFGWFIGRSAFGGDLYRDGRDATLPVRGGPTSAQCHLTAAWQRARIALDEDLSDAEHDDVDAVIQGRRPLPSETAPSAPKLVSTTAAPVADPRGSVEPTSSIGTRAAIPEHRTGTTRADDVGSRPSPFGSLIVPRTRGSMRLEAEVVTWGFVVFDVTDGPARCHLTVPGPELESFLDRLDHGLLDGVLGRWLRRPRRAKLSKASQTGSSQAYRDVADPSSLLPAERDPVTGRFLRGAGGEGAGGNRPGKRRHDQNPPSPHAGWVRPLVVVGAVLAVLAIVAAALTIGRDRSEPVRVAAGPSTQRGAASNGSSHETVADYGTWQSTAGTISLERRGDRLIGTVVEVAAVDQVPGCRLQVGQQLFSVTADAPSTVDTTPSFPNARPFIGSGTGTLQRWNAGGGGCAAALTDDVPLFVVVGREGGQLPGSATVEPSLSLAKSPDLATTALPEWFPFDFRFTRVGATAASPSNSLQGASP